jgi:hypothetical protein
MSVHHETMTANDRARDRAMEWSWLWLSEVKTRENPFQWNSPSLHGYRKMEVVPERRILEHDIPILLHSVMKLVPMAIARVVCGRVTI